MKTHRCFFLFVLAAALWVWWQQAQPYRFTVYTGRPDPRVLSLMRRQGARFEVIPQGFRLACDQAGFEAMYRMMRYHQFAADVCTQNLANARTLRTADGTPYRRRFVTMGPGGEPKVEVSRGDFNRVYDPQNPNAAADGSHKGYVAMPCIDVLTEMSELRTHQQLAEAYGSLLERFEARRPDLVVFKCAPELNPVGCFAVR